MDKLVCFHLLNDFSGSPKILSLIMERLANKGIRIDVITSKGEGFLSGLAKRKEVRINQYTYRFSSNGLVTMLRYCSVQLYIFLLAFQYLFSRNTVFYINTILPVGAALAGRLMGKRVVYHYHENASVKGVFYRLLAGIMQRLASKIICVSNYQRSFLKRKKGVYVVPNAVPKVFVEQLRPNPQGAFERKRVLMLGSLKGYKGTQEFIELASRLKMYEFELVLNETSKNIASFLRKNGLVQPENLTIYSRQNNVVPFYNRASVVLNLTNKNMAIETFGLTALEAMSAGLPVIVPTVGGIAELVEDGVNGYRIDVQNLEKIEQAIQNILTHKELYLKLAKGAWSCSQKYSEQAMIESIENILD